MRGVQFPTYHSPNKNLQRASLLSMNCALEKKPPTTRDLYSCRDERMALAADVSRQLEIAAPHIFGAPPVQPRQSRKNFVVSPMRATSFFVCSNFTRWLSRFSRSSRWSGMLAPVCCRRASRPSLSRTTDRLRIRRLPFSPLSLRSLAESCSSANSIRRAAALLCRDVCESFSSVLFFPDSNLFRSLSKRKSQRQHSTSHHFLP